MALNFEDIKRIPMTAVVWRYHIRLKIKEKDGKKYGRVQCPLPTHKEGDRAENFTIDIAGNFWKCWSDSCNQNNGGKKGGDCINFVAAMDKCSQVDAARKLAEWFGIKNPALVRAGAVREDKSPPPPNIKDNTRIAVAIKYTDKVRQWWEEAWGPLENEAGENRRYSINGVIIRLLLPERVGENKPVTPRDERLGVLQHDWAGDFL